VASALPYVPEGVIAGQPAVLEVLKRLIVVQAPTLAFTGLRRAMNQLQEAVDTAVASRKQRTKREQKLEKSVEEFQTVDATLDSLKERLSACYTSIHNVETELNEYWRTEPTKSRKKYLAAVERIRSMPSAVWNKIRQLKMPMPFPAVEKVFRGVALLVGQQFVWSKFSLFFADSRVNISRGNREAMLHKYDLRLLHYLDEVMDIEALAQSNTTDRLTAYISDPNFTPDNIFLGMVSPALAPLCELVQAAYYYARNMRHQRPLYQQLEAARIQAEIAEKSKVEALAQRSAIVSATARNRALWEASVTEEAECVKVVVQARLMVMEASLMQRQFHGVTAADGITFRRQGGAVDMEVMMGLDLALDGATDERATLRLMKQASEFGPSEARLLHHVEQAWLAKFGKLEPYPWQLLLHDKDYKPLWEPPPGVSGLDDDIPDDWPPAPSREVIDSGQVGTRMSSAVAAELEPGDELAAVPPLRLLYTELVPCPWSMPVENWHLEAEPESSDEEIVEKEAEVLWTTQKVLEEVGAAASSGPGSAEMGPMVHVPAVSEESKAMSAGRPSATLLPPGAQSKASVSPRASRASRASRSRSKPGSVVRSSPEQKHVALGEGQRAPKRPWRKGQPLWPELLDAAHEGRMAVQWPGEDRGKAGFKRSKRPARVERRETFFVYDSDA
jgi:hypothetical protein